tara:strand:- start:271 stop:477 length:207 start_codon:yes stop_codon:yes gene_type:complete
VACFFPGTFKEDKSCFPLIAALAEMKAGMPGCFNEELLKEFICFLGAKDSRNKPRPNDTLITSPSLSK